jgi:hypothetical protein
MYIECEQIYENEIMWNMETIYYIDQQFIIKILQQKLAVNDFMEHQLDGQKTMNESIFEKHCS